MVSGESEFFAIPSSFHGNLHGLLSPTVADHFYLRSVYGAENLSTPLFPYSHHQQMVNAIQRKGMPTPLMGPFNHGQKTASVGPKLFGHASSSVKLFYQRLSVPIRELESLCQLRCIFVDSTHVREVAKIILIASRSSTVADLLCIARSELRRIGVVMTDCNREKYSTFPEAQLARQEVSNSSQIKIEQEPPLRLLETLNSWIIQQYSPDQLTSQLQLLDNRLLRIEIIPSDECSTLRSFSKKMSVSCADTSSPSIHPLLQGEETPPVPNLLYPISFKDLVDIRADDDDDDDEEEEEEEVEEEDEEDDVNGEEDDEDDDDLAACDSEENGNGEFDDEDDDEDEEDDEDEDEDEEVNNDEFPRRKLSLNNDEDDISSVLKLMLNPPEGNIDKSILSSPEVFDSYKSSDSVSCESILHEPDGLSFSLDIPRKDSVSSNDPVLLNESCSPDRVVEHQQNTTKSPTSLGKSVSDGKAAPPHLSSTNITPEFEIVDQAHKKCSLDNLSVMSDTVASITSNNTKPTSIPGVQQHLLQIPENVLVPKSLVVTCGHFFRGDPSYGGFGLPFTLVLHHGERISSLLGRLRCRLGASILEAEKWRLAVLPGPIPSISSVHFDQFRSSIRGLEPLMPTQESLLMMRPTYLPSELDACLNLCHFLTPQMSASFNTAMLATARSSSSPTAASLAETSRSEFSRLLLLFGLRPWLGIEHKIQPKRPRCMLSEKPIRILN